MFKSKKISDRVTEALYHSLFFPLYYIFFRITGKNNSQAVESYQKSFESKSEFVVFIILFIAISFLIVLIDTLKT